MCVSFPCPSTEHKYTMPWVHVAEEVLALSCRHILVKTALIPAGCSVAAMFMEEMPSDQVSLNTTGDLYENRWSAIQNTFQKEYKKCTLYYVHIHPVLCLDALLHRGYLLEK